jgi:cAMP-dependent protein kinase regulator
MGCTESKEAVAAKSATSADNASTAARAKARAKARAAAAANPTAASTAVSAVASTVSAAGATTYKAFRDPSVALRNIVDTSKTVGAKVSEKAATQAHHVRNVFATPIDVQDFKSYKPPVHKKSIASTKFIVAALQHNFVFEQLSEKELFPLVQAFESIVVPSAEVIIKQGDGGDYFYIIETGQCAFEVDGKEVGRASKGNSFGELALLYTCPRAATVTALVETTLYRVDQKTFRFILQNQTEQGSSQKGELLAGVDFLKDLEAADIAKLASVMTPKRFSTGDYLIHKGDAADYFYLVAEGTLTVCDIGIGDAKYEDVILKVGDYVGERALVTGDPRAANVVAKTDGMAFSVDKETFDTVLGQLSVLILRSQDKVKLVRIFIEILCVLCFVLPLPVAIGSTEGTQRHR